MITAISGATARPLGLAGYPKQSPRSVAAAFDAGVNYYFFYGPSHISVIDGLRRLVKRQRDEVIIGCGGGSRQARGLERVRRRVARDLGTPIIDVFFMEYLNPSDDFAAVFGAGGPVEALCGWRDDGHIRFVGISTHDASVAKRCIEDGRVDVLMLRCNMAHRRLASAVFPEAQAAGVSVTAFTATRWGTLLRGHPDWPHAPPSALDCYRYCASQPAVEVVLSGARTLKELRENVGLLTLTGLDPEERARWEAYGDLVYGTDGGKFETAWP